MRLHTIAIDRNGVEPVRHRVFFRLMLPLGVVANLALGLLVLSNLQTETWPRWLQLGAGAFCCCVAGWLVAAAWSRLYWRQAFAGRVALWKRIAGAFFTWLEEVPVPPDALERLEASLEEVVPNPRGA